MPELYTELNKTPWIFQPNFVRWRHRHKGVRESLKINTEIHQAYYDVRRLEYKADVVLEYLEEKNAFIEEGGYLSGVEFQISEDATPGINPMYITGMDDLIARIDSMKKRVEDLEE